MTALWSGVAEGLPYSLSRWTDISGDASKWAWLEAALRKGSMRAFDPRDAIPKDWSLLREDVKELILWTKSPERLVRGASFLRDLPLKIHVTITGWHEVEPGAPSIEEAAGWTQRLVAAFGQKVTWRFSPIPLLLDEEVERRFADIAGRLGGCATEVFVSFLAENEFLAETRSPEERGVLLECLSKIASSNGIALRLCQDDEISLVRSGRVERGVCAPADGRTSKCGCGLAVDPFTLNESCSISCAYCYVLDRSISPRKRNTTRLPVIG
jgi:hypothetical protein